MKNKFLLWSRFVLIAFLILVQFFWLVAVFCKFSYQFTYANYVIRIVAVTIVLHIVNRSMNPNNKLLWTFLILMSPVFGVLLYLILGRRGASLANYKKMDRIKNEMLKYLLQNPEVSQAIETQDKTVYRQIKYINDWSGYPVYGNTDTKYYKCGEEMFPDMIVALEQAEAFVFMEYYIIETGYMLNRILEILERKVQAGLDVRLIYDDIGSIGTVPKDYAKTLEQRGIKCLPFQPFRPFMSVLFNNRDHRKMMIVDGKIGFIGGMNLADEYINHVERYGYWKDTVVRLDGEAVRSLVVMFLAMWQYVGGVKEDVDLIFGEYQCVSKLKRNMLDNAVDSNLEAIMGERIGERGSEEFQERFVQPYCDCPFDEEYVGETVYLNIINQAVDYVYIFTPYLIIDNEMITSLMNAAKRGVDVRIVTPGVPDKRIIYWITQSFYRVLIKGGVKIYQYRPGFLHAKSFLCDDKIATVGSVNLDYRSLYLHFECGVFLYQCKAVEEMKVDYLEVFACSDEVTLSFCESQHILIQLFQGVMRLLAPLL